MKGFEILFIALLVAVTVLFSACQQEEVLPEQTPQVETTNTIGHTNGVLASTIFLTDMPAGYESSLKEFRYLGFCTSHITENKYYISNNKEFDATGIMGWSDDQYAFYLRAGESINSSNEHLIPYSVSCNTSSVVMPIESSGYGYDPEIGNFYSEYYGMYTLPPNSQATHVVFTIHYKVVK